MLSVLIVLLLSVQSKVLAAPKVPCFFIFGDSLVDSGNNNLLSTSAKVNYPPYGIDFPEGPTGRFCNGRTVVDFIGEQLGFTQFITSYANSSKANITQGVNYASGSAGIQKITGQHLGANVGLDMQLMHHHDIRERLVANFGNEDATTQHLNKCFYYVGIGSNDYLNNYFLPEYHTKSKFTQEQYAQVLTEQLSRQLHTLYEYGARKIAVVGAGNIGCAPAIIKQYAPKNTQCVDEMNVAISFYNNNLKSLVDKLNKDLVGASFIFVNVSAATAGPGLKVTSTGPCCPLRSDGQCTQGSVPCSNRDQTVFFDGFHPTEAANRFVAMRAFSTLSLTEAYPVPISELLQQKSYASHGHDL